MHHNWLLYFEHSLRPSSLSILNCGFVHTSEMSDVGACRLCLIPQELVYVLIPLKLIQQCLIYSHLYGFLYCTGLRIRNHVASSHVLGFFLLCAVEMMLMRAAGIRYVSRDHNFCAQLSFCPSRLRSVRILMIVAGM